MSATLVGTSPVAMRRITLAAIVTNVAIVVTGGAVRLTGSGLGCPEWPTCNEGSVVPVDATDVAAWHQAIEFGNRLLSFVVLAVALAALLAAMRLRPRRRDVVRLAALLPIGVFAQGVIGGITVLTGLHPLIVAAHFLTSIAIIAAAVALHHRVRREPGPTHSVVHPELRRVQHVLLVVLAGVLTLGTLVTATGPHAGDADTPRLGLDPRLISQFHADGVFLLLGLTVALWFGLRATDAPARVQRAATVLAGVVVAQGLIGYVQYFTGLPEVLVGAHLLGACLVWIAALHLWLTSTVHSPTSQHAGTHATA
ncbi:MAG: COX15/CtaA family protein [Actinobacteria bacterium]|nr:COX15/CtaA family protein [Actinomycetota bacterium]